MSRAGYTIHEVVEMTGVKKRTLEDWRRLKLLPPPIAGTGKRTALYDDEYVRAVQRIKDDLVDKRTTRSEFAERLRYEGRRY